MPAHTTTRRAPRSPEEWDRVALEEIVPMLVGGAQMQEVRAIYGAGPKIRKVLWRNGYNTKGEQVGAPTTLKGAGKVLAARVAKRREAGASWGKLQLETGRDEDALKELLIKHGHQELAVGRVIISERGKRKAEKAPVAKAKPVRKPRARKPKAEAEQPVAA